ncbi:MAG: hypothetical protein P4M10_06390, partial [Verrucomicrobiae bacterium]|nr:hypothetical protein [Verrucomicrobiae bacterium]
VADPGEQGQDLRIEQAMDDHGQSLAARPEDTKRQRFAIRHFTRLLILVERQPQAGHSVGIHYLTLFIF